MQRLTLNREHMTLHEKQFEYLKGFVLRERMMGTIAFKFRGEHYTSSKKRATKVQRIYSLKSDWKYNEYSNVAYKLWLIATSKVHKIILKD